MSSKDMGQTNSGVAGQPSALKDDLLQGAAAVADYTGLDRRLIYRMVELNEIPHKRMGRRLFFRKSELDKAFSSE